MIGVTRKGERLVLRTRICQLLAGQTFFYGNCRSISKGGELHPARHIASESELKSYQIASDEREFQNSDEADLRPSESHVEVKATMPAASSSSNGNSTASSRFCSYNSYRTGSYPYGFPRLRAFFCSTSNQEQRKAPLKVEEFLNSLRNFEAEGVPKGAGTESSDGFDLGRMSRLLERLADPLSQYPVVHVAGTKGKGSTVSFLSHILRAAGFNVGSYTSPHIRSLRERIVSGATGEMVSAKAFDDVFEKVEQKLIDAVRAEAGTLTHFELLTALAFVHFAEEQVDVAVIEAGLGGSRDATNVIQASGLLAAVIVGIGEEHLEALGGSLESIARAKAGIIKQGRPVILGKQTESLAEGVIRDVASSKDAVVLPPLGCSALYTVKGVEANVSSPYQLCDIEVCTSSDENDSSTEAQFWSMKDLKVPVLGAHQLDNVASAIQTALCLRGEGWGISDSAIRHGIECTKISGRFEILTEAAVDTLGASGCTVIVDGAHTLASAEALARTLRGAYLDHSFAFVVAMASDKDHKGFARALLTGARPHVVVAATTGIAGSSKRSLPASVILESFVAAGQDLGIRLCLDHHDEVEHRYGDAKISPARAGSDLTPDHDQKYGLANAELGQEQIFVIEAGAISLAIHAAARSLRECCGERRGIICITGSLHAVAETLSLF